MDDAYNIIHYFLLKLVRVWLYKCTTLLVTQLRKASKLSYNMEVLAKPC